MRFFHTVWNTILVLSTREMKIMMAKMSKEMTDKMMTKNNRRTQKRRRSQNQKKNQIQKEKIRKMQLPKSQNANSNEN